MYQIFVRSNNHSLALEVEAKWSVEQLQAVIEDREGVPSSQQRLYMGGRPLAPAKTLHECAIGPEASLDLTLPLLGGKGGFGNLLKHAHVQSKVTNYDACRDLSGRRVRYVEAEKKMKEWNASKGERELEKQALEHIKKLEKEEAARRKEVVVEDEALRAQQAALAQIPAQVARAVRSGLASSARLEEDRKRRKAEDGERQARAAKRMRLVGLEDDEALSSEDEGAGAGQPVAAPAAEAPARLRGVPKEASPAPGPGPTPVDAPPREASGAAAGPPASGREAKAKAAPKAAFDPSAYAPVDLRQVGSAGELAALGLDHLKAELLRRGAKCGGTVQERAARLFALKGGEGEGGASGNAN